MRWLNHQANVRVYMPKMELITFFSNNNVAYFQKLESQNIHTHTCTTHELERRQLQYKLR